MKKGISYVHAVWIIISNKDCPKNERVTEEITSKSKFVLAIRIIMSFK